MVIRRACPSGLINMKQYVRLFSERGDEFDRYWASISTEISKDGKGTGDYITANISVRLSKEAKEAYNAAAVKSKTKGIKHCRGKADGWLKAVAGKESNFVVWFIDDFEPVKSKEDDE